MNFLTIDYAMGVHFSRVYNIYIYFYFVGDCLQCVSAAVLRALGVHDYAFKVMMIIYFGFGVILSYIITHKLKIYYRIDRY